MYVCTHIITYVPMIQSTEHYVKCNVFYVYIVVFMLNGVCTVCDLPCTGCVCVRHICEISDVKDFKGNRLVS